MTESKFLTKQGTLIGFELKGHAGAGSIGNDIVCAAVSSAALMTVNTITEIYGISADIVKREGYLKVKLSLDDAKRCHKLLEGFHLHLNELQKLYPNNVNVLMEV